MEELLTAGIDFGTSKSVIAIHDGTSAQVITAPNKERAVPSVVFFDPKRAKPIVGREAVNEGKDKSQFCIYHAKRWLNERWREEETGWQTGKGPDGMTWFHGPDRLYSPTEIASYVIRELLDYAELRLRGKRPNGAVLTHPAHFTTPQKDCLIDAAVMAGLSRERIHLLAEPTAAGIAYGLDSQNIQMHAVYDMGAGTFDIAYLHGGKTRGKTALDVKWSDALPRGGVNADMEIVEWLKDEYFKKYQSDLGRDGEAMERLRIAAEKAKIALSEHGKTEARIDIALIEFSPPRSLSETLTRTHLENMLKPLIEETLACCESALAACGLTKGNISQWILVGGMTNVPCIREAVHDFAGKEPRVDIDPDEVVAIGAATYAAANIDKRFKPFSLTNRVAHDFGFEAKGNVFHKVIRKGSPYNTEVTVPITSMEDDQPELSIHVLEGGQFSATESQRLAAHDIPWPGGPKRSKALALTFKVDEEGRKSIRTPDGVIYNEVA